MQGLTSPISADRIRVLEGHTHPVTAVALSSDGKCAVSGSNDKTLRVWNLEGSQLRRVLIGHTGPVKAVALSGDGRRVVSGSYDKTLRVWDLEGNQPPRILEGHTGWVNAVALSGDGKRAVSGSDDKTVRVWDLEGNQPSRVLEGHTSGVEDVALSADGRRAVSGSFDKLHRPFPDCRPPSRSPIPRMRIHLYFRTARIVFMSCDSTRSWLDWSQIHKSRPQNQITREEGCSSYWALAGDNIEFKARIEPINHQVAPSSATG